MIPHDFAEDSFSYQVLVVFIVKKRAFVGIGLVVCVLFAGCERGSKRADVGNRVMESGNVEVDQAVVEDFSVDDLIGQVEALRDREFRRRPRFVAEAGVRLAVGEGTAFDDEAVRRDREVIVEGLMGRAWTKADLGSDEFAALARFDAGTGSVRYANGYEDRGMLRLALVLALVKGLNAEYFEPVAGAKSWDEVLALEAAAIGDAMFVAAQLELNSEGNAIKSEEIARFPEAALRNKVMGRVLSGVSGSGVGAEGGFSVREGYALASALYRANGWSGVEMMKHGPARSSGYVVRPDRWFSGEDLGTWSWPAELEAGWDDEQYWYPGVQSGRVGPGIIAMWLGQTIDPAAARTVYAGWRSDEYRMYHGKRIPSARRKGAKVFEWVSQWDTPHSAAQVADAFRLVLERGQTEREDEAGHVVVQNGLSVAVIVTDSDDNRFGPVSKLVDRAGVLSGAVVRYGQVQGLPFVFQPTRLETFLVGAAAAVLDEERFEDPASGVEMDLGVLKKGWRVQKTNEASIRWFARSGEGDDGGLIQFTTELRDVLGPAFGTEAYRQKIEAAFEGSSGGGTVEARYLEGASGSFAGGSVLGIRGEGSIQGTSRVLWVRQFVVGDIVCTLSLQGVPAHMDADVATVKAVFDGISFEPVVESVQSDEDSGIRIQVED